MSNPESIDDRVGITAGEVDQLLTDMMPALSASVTEAEPTYALTDQLPAEQKVLIPEKAARGWSCQQLASLVREVLQNEGLTDARILKKDLRSLGPQFLEHIVVNFQLDGECWYVDPTYSQVFKHFGLHFHQLRPGHSPYPDELHVMYRAKDVPELALWAASVMKMYWQTYGYDLRFQQAYNYTVADDGWDAAQPQLMRPPSQSQMEQTFLSIWDVEGYEPFTGPRSSNKENLARLHTNALRLRSAA